jgi:hypothetical protein
LQGLQDGLFIVDMRGRVRIGAVLDTLQVLELGPERVARALGGESVKNRCGAGEGTVKIMPAMRNGT